LAIRVPIVSEFNRKGIDRAIADFKQLETKTAKAGFVMQKAFVPAVAALGGLAAAAVPAVSAASDLSESMSKVGVIFGEGADEVTRFADTAADKLGQSKQAVLDAAGTFGTFGKAAGLSGEELAGFSNDFTTLATDLASFNNTTPEEAVNAIGAALRGEAEPMRRFGVLLNDATLKAEAMTLGIYDGSGALTDQQKILAAQSAIFKQTGDAQGDFARTSDGLANQTRRLQAQFADVQAELGMALLPVIEAILPLLSNMADFVANNTDVVLVLAGVLAGLATTVIAVNAAMKVYAAYQALATAATWLFNTALLANPITWIVLAIAGLVAGLILLEKKFGIVTEAVKALFKVLEKIGDAIGWVAKKLGLASDETEELAKQTENLETASDNAAGSMAVVTEEAQRQYDEMAAARYEAHSLGAELTVVAEASDDAAEAQSNLATQVNKVYRDLFELNPQLERMLKAIEQDDAVDDFAEAVAALHDPALIASGDLQAIEEATEDVYVQLGKAIEAFGTISQARQERLTIMVDSGQADRAAAALERLAEARKKVAQAPPSTYVPDPTFESSITGGTMAKPITTTTISGGTIITRDNATGAVTQSVTVNAAVVRSDAELGKVVNDALNAFNRTSGPANFALRTTAGSFG